jgi:hypothetical protein
MRRRRASCRSVSGGESDWSVRTTACALFAAAGLVAGFSASVAERLAFVAGCAVAGRAVVGRSVFGCAVFAGGLASAGMCPVP